MSKIQTISGRSEAKLKRKGKPQEDETGTISCLSVVYLTEIMS